MLRLKYQRLLGKDSSNDLCTCTSYRRRKVKGKLKEGSKEDIYHSEITEMFLKSKRIVPHGYFLYSYTRRQTCVHYCISID